MRGDISHENELLDLGVMREATEAIEVRDRLEEDVISQQLEFDLVRSD